MAVIEPYTTERMPRYAAFTHRWDKLYDSAGIELSERKRLHLRMDFGLFNDAHFGHGHTIILAAGDTHTSCIARLCAIQGVAKISSYCYCLIFQKGRLFDWDRELKPAIIEVIMEEFNMPFGASAEAVADEVTADRAQRRVVVR